LRARRTRALAKPNILVILTDDQPPRTFNPRYMPKTWQRLVEQGVRFPKAYAAIPACGPARASILKGQYSHNHGILVNNDGARFDRIDSDTIATRLRRAGYSTGLFGKYMNDHDPNRIAPGWDRWFAFHSGYQDPVYKMMTNSGVQSFDRSRWDETRLLADKAQSWIGGTPGPWFAYVAPNDPHGPYFPSPRHLHEYDGAAVPKSPNYNEADRSDKPEFIREQPPVDKQRQDPKEINEGKLEELRDVDDLVDQLVGMLARSARLGNTYVFFCSDNGWLNGEHRFIGKGVPYEGSTKVPFAMRGPGVAPNVVSPALVSQVDLSATICELAGGSVSGMDGRSLRPVFGSGGSAPPSSWRKRLLSESPRMPPGEPAGGWYKLREGNWTYAEWGTDERELYNLSNDPYELRSLHAEPAYQNVKADLATKLAALRSASGEELRAAEE
jgi:arylsulfatase A-like enzyme